MRTVSRMTLLFTLINSEYTITGYEGNLNNIIIPALYNSLPVTSIADLAFSRNGDNPELNNVIFEEPSNITRIGSHAFYMCGNLTITLPDSILDIGEDAFTGVGGMLYNSNGITFEGLPPAGSGQVGNTNGYYQYVRSTEWGSYSSQYRGLTMQPYISSQTTMRPKLQIGSLYGITVSENIFSSIYSSGNPAGLVFDALDNLFIADYSNNFLAILPSNPTTLYGKDFSANTITSLSSLDVKYLLNGPNCLAIDTARNICISCDNRSYISVLSSMTQFYGLNISANVISNLSGADINRVLSKPVSIAFDPSNNLFIADVSRNYLAILPKTSTSIYDRDFSANIITCLSGLDVKNLLIRPNCIAIDSSRTIFIGLSTSICVLPQTTTNIYGTDCSANVVSVLNLSSTIKSVSSLTFDTKGNLFISSQLDNCIYVLPKSDINIYGIQCPSNVITSLADILQSSTLNGPSQIVFDMNGNMYIGSKQIQPICVVLAPVPTTVPTFPVSIFGYYYATETTYIFNQKTVKHLIATPKRVRNWTQGMYPPVGTSLKNTGRRVVVFGSNKLKTYEFYEVQRTDTMESGYLCVWAASGIPPTSL